MQEGNEMTKKQQEAFESVVNLRRLTKETGTKTTRAQNAILQTLNDADLVVVANALSKQ